MAYSIFYIKGFGGRQLRCTHGYRYIQTTQWFLSCANNPQPAKLTDKFMLQGFHASPSILRGE